MEDLLGFVIFIIFVAISIIGKLKSNPKTDEEDPSQPARPLTLDELPDATRRMLFGDGGDIIVAKPKRVAVEEEDAFGENSPARENLPSPVPARQVLFERPGPVTTPLQTRQQAPRPVTVSPRPQPVQQPVQQPPGRRLQVQRRQQPQVCVQPTPVPPTSSASAETTKPSAAFSKPRMMGPASVITLVGSRNALRQSVLAREILGPPRAFDY